MTETELAYIAGIIESRGNLRLYPRKGKTPYPRIELVCNDKDILVPLTRIMGVVKPCERKGKPAWRWGVTCSSARHLIEKLRPYLRVKTDDADAILAWEPQRAGKKPKPRDPGWAGIKKISMTKDGRGFGRRA